MSRRYRVTDMPYRSLDAARRTHVATFHGQHFVAERQGDDLHVHLLHGDDEMVGGVHVFSGKGTIDRSDVFGAPNSQAAALAAWNKRNAEFWSDPERRRRAR